MASTPINEVAGLSYYANREVDWSLVVIIFAGILTIIVLVTIFFIIPHYVQPYIQKTVNDGFENAIGNISG
ncbi:MAG: hypothetical protein ABSG05_01295 [Candidatus Pacearchaeota archaeon]|jgi:hypothetical protein